MKLKNLIYFLIPVVSVMLLGFVNSKDTKKMNLIQKKVDSLLSVMTLDEKIGQMVQIDHDAIKKNPEDITKYSIGSVLWGGNSEIDDLSPKGWADVATDYQSYALKTRLKIPLIFGIDAVHGHNNVIGAVIFPHNIGLGCTRNPGLVEKAARVTAEEIAATGIHWDFAPCIAVARNEKWGRTYESFGETPELAQSLGEAYIKGLQGNLSDKTSVLACAKHYMGDGGTTNGKDQGNTELTEKELRRIHLPGYINAIKAGTATIMASYNSWNGEKLHGHKYLMTDVLKNELKFKGFIVSDWAAIDQLDTDYKKTIEKSVNAGMDMVMIPNGAGQKNNYVEFITYIKELINEKKISMERIDDAVRRILTVKVEMDIFNHPTTDKADLDKVGSEAHRNVARECVRQSLVLLKNDNKTLPLKKDVKIHVAGRSADDIGNQCGGWTIIWQGKSGKVTEGGTTILEGIKKTVGNQAQVSYSKDAKGAKGSDVCVVVVGETPYAEMFGDTSDLSLNPADIEAINNAKAAGVPVVAVLLSGRPMIIEPVLKNCDAFVAAWLPGTEGQGVADVLFGDYKFTGKLSHSWPKDMKQIPINVGDKNYSPLFKYGFGLSY